RAERSTSNYAAFSYLPSYLRQVHLDRLAYSEKCDSTRSLLWFNHLRRRDCVGRCAGLLEVADIRQRRVGDGTESVAREKCLMPGNDHVRECEQTGEHLILYDFVG